MVSAYINRIGTAVPPFDVHAKFVSYAPKLLREGRDRRLFARMADRAGIEHRFSFLQPDPAIEALDTQGFYRAGAFPDTGERMRFFERHAFDLGRKAVSELGIQVQAQEITHLIAVSCTGFYAQGLDLQVVEHFGLRPTVERTVVGFMGCYAAINALKLARHIVRSQPDAKVLVLNLELCTIHLQEIDDLEQVLSFLIFGDGAAACLVSAEPTGLRIEDFHSTVLPGSSDQITWRIGGAGFDMVLSGKVPRTIGHGLPPSMDRILNGWAPEDVALWAIHPGGRTIIDAVQDALGLGDEQVATSRGVLRRFGNMSSATIMFVLKEMMAARPARGLLGCAMAFGPGLTAESMLLRTAGA